METISVKSKSPFSFKAIEAMLSQYGQHWSIEASAGTTLTLLGDSSRAYLYLGADAKEPDMHCLWLDYSDVNLAKRVLEVIADDPSLTVDNDFGTVLSGRQFADRCRAEPEWDWRRAKPS